MCRFSTKISAKKEKYPILLSNGNLIEEKVDNGIYEVVWEDPFPKPCYLFAIVAGDLDVLIDHHTTAFSKRKVELRIYTDKGMIKYAKHAMYALKDSMLWDEKVFGREYDLNLYMIVAVDSFNFGAMENKGLNIFNSSVVFADSQTATDNDFIRISEVISHEYFHNWTGNRITCRDWFQLTLKEGLTVYRDEEYIADTTNREIKRINTINGLWNSQYSEDSGPNAHPIRPDSYIEIDNFYTSTVYRKGAAFIRMIAEYIGKEKFRNGMDTYFNSFDGMAVTCDDFIDAIEKGSGVDLSTLRRWYSQAGTPRVNIDLIFNKDSSSVKLKLTQSNAKHVEDKGPLGFPFPVTLYSNDGKILAQEKLLMKNKEHELTFNNIDHKPTPSFLDGHISPVIVDYQYTQEELINLILSSKDYFNKYDASQRLFKNVINDMLKGKSEGITSKIVNLFKKIILDETISTGLRSYMITIPSLQIITDEQEEPDFQKSF